MTLYTLKNIKTWDVEVGIAIGRLVEFSKFDDSYKLNVIASCHKFLKY